MAPRMVRNFGAFSRCFDISYVFDSVTPLMYGRDAKDLRDSEGSTKLKNIPRSSTNLWKAPLD